MKQDEVISMAFKAGKGDDDWIILLKQLFKHFPKEFNEFVALLAAHEREACAKVVETLWDTPTNGMATEEQFYGNECAKVIRARGQA